MIKLMITLTE